MIGMTALAACPPQLHHSLSWVLTFSQPWQASANSPQRLVQRPALPQEPR